MTEARIEQRRDYLPWLDGLRAVAVLAVVIYHLDLGWLPGGLLGVDVFFVISGFVVCAASAAAPVSRVGAFAVWFYARRLRRLAPALILCLLLTGLASAMLLPPTELTDGSRRVGVAAFFGLANWQLARAGSDYFAATTEFNPYAHTWSLGVEEQFYLLFPLLFAAWLGRPASRRWLLGLLLVLTAGSMICAWVWTRDGHGLAAFYLLPARLWELAIGVLLYFALAGRRVDAARSQGTGSAVLFAPLALLTLGGSLLLARPAQVPWPDALPAVLATAALIALLFRRNGGAVGWLLSRSWLTAIGRMSYSIYLWHWSVFVLLRWTLGFDSWEHRVIGLVLAMGLATASYRWVEQPLRYGDGAAFRSRSVVAAGVAGLIACAALFYVIHAVAPALSMSAVARHGEDWRPEAVAARGESVCAVERIVEATEPLRVWRFVAGECAATSETQPRLFVLGDSHALGYISLLRRLAAMQGTEIWLYHREGCAVVDPLDNRDIDEPACRAASAFALADIGQRMRRGDLLFLPSLRLPRLSEPWQIIDAQKAMESMSSDSAERQRSRSVAVAIDRLQPLAAAGLKVVIEAPKPLLPAPPFRCADAHTHHNPICAGGASISRVDMEVLRAPTVSVLTEIVAALPGAQLWDPLPILCPNTNCSASLEGRPLYFDGDHLSGHGNRLLYPAFVSEVLGNPPGEAVGRIPEQMVRSSIVAPPPRGCRLLLTDLVRRGPARLSKTGVCRKQGSESEVSPLFIRSLAHRRRE